MSKTLVLFDFDGTLTKRDTFPQFIFFSVGYLKGLLGFLIFFPFVFLFLAKLMDGAKLKAKLVRFYFKGKEEEKLNQLGKAFIEKLIQTNSFKEDVLEKFEAYKSKSDEVCIVSASLNIWIRAFAKMHNIDYLCTELEFENGIYTEQLKTPNYNRTEKAIRIRKKFNLADYSEIIAYGNSTGDKAMFELSTKANLV